MKGESVPKCCGLLHSTKKRAWNFEGCFHGLKISSCLSRTSMLVPISCRLFSVNDRIKKLEQFLSGRILWFAKVIIQLAMVRFTFAEGFG
jgi:hypothetical protein